MSVLLLYGFLSSWAVVIVLFYGLLEHRKERFRLAISIAGLSIGIVVGLSCFFFAWLTFDQAIVFFVGWAVPCVLHVLFGRAPGMLVLRFLTRIFRGKSS